MPRNEQPAEPQPLLRLRGLLVFGLLVGLLGMHGLGLVPAQAQATSHVRAAENAHGVAAMAAMESTPDECGPDGHGQDRPADHHADPTCASGALAGPLEFLALVPTVIGRALPTGGPITALGSGPDGGRSPPSLSELQILRI